MGPGGIYIHDCWGIDVTARPLLIISKRQGSGRAHKDWKKANVTSYIQEGKRGELQSDQPHCNYWEDELEKNSLRRIVQTYYGERGDEEYQFMKEKLCSISPIVISL